MRHDSSELFRSTAPYYALHRPGYPQEFFDYLVTRLGLNRTQQVLDLGCGPGQIALPLARHVARVLAVDPEPSMLAEGRHLAEQRGIDNIDWLRGDSYRLGELNLGELSLATMGASFHWMDRDAVLDALNHHVQTGGAVVIASGGPPETKTPPPWHDTVAAIRTQYLGPERRAGSTTYRHPEESHAEMLRRSPFSNVETLEWSRTLERDIDSVVGLQFSYSFSAPAQFSGEDQRTAFERDIRDALAEQFPSGTFSENIRTEALIATRP